MMLETSTSILNMVSGQEGNFNVRELDTRTKHGPSSGEFKKINKVISELLKQNSVLPVENPFEYLWLINCVVYAVVVAFLVQ